MDLLLLAPEIQEAILFLRRTYDGRAHPRAPRASHLRCPGVAEAAEDAGRPSWLERAFLPGPSMTCCGSASGADWWDG
jgi:hypothetical protein